jgi:transcriptional antiterminator NusG
MLMDEKGLEVIEPEASESEVASDDVTEDIAEDVAEDTADDAADDAAAGAADDEAAVAADDAVADAVDDEAADAADDTVAHAADDEATDAANDEVASAADDAAADAADDEVANAADDAVGDATDDEAPDAADDAVADAPDDQAADAPEPGDGPPAAPEELARQLFATYLEPSESEPERKPEAGSEGIPPVVPGDEIDLEHLLGQEGEETDGLVQAEKSEPDQAAEADAEEEVSPEGRNWFVIHSYSGYENKVKKNLEHRIESLGMQDKIFDVVVPTEEEIELKDGQRRTVERRIFPGYILVEMLMDEDSWYVVRNTPGVTGFVGSIRRPTPLRGRDVDRILKRMRAETPRVKVTFRPGQKVRICDGPFEDFVGSVDDIYPDKGKVRILVSFFGRETPVELDFLQVEKI